MSKKIHLALVIILTGLGLYTLFSALPFGADYSGDPIREISSVHLCLDHSSREETLPLSLSGLEPRSRVTLSFQRSEGDGDTLFFGSVYAPLAIAVDGQILYEYGREEDYPSFFIDPPTCYDSLSLPRDAREIEMTYLSPVERSTLSIHAPLLGTNGSILHTLLSRCGLSLLMALFFLFLGAVLALISPFFLLRQDHNGIFLQMGLLCLFAGCWQFGENTLAVYLLSRPSLLYVLDFLGLFLLVIPLYQIGISFVSEKSKGFLRIVNALMELSVLVSVLLLLSGKVPFHRSLYYFHVLLPLSITILTLFVLFEYLRYRTRTAGLFIVPFVILTLAALMELLNYRLRFFSQLSVLFQIGLFLFILTMAVFSFTYIRDIYRLYVKNLLLENELKLSEQTITAQKKRNELLLGHFEEIRRQRHDIRHHLRTLSDMLSRGETEGARLYIESLSDSIPRYTPEHWCDNVIINATLSYYAQQAGEAQVRLNILAQVPENNPHFSDANLCVVFGNLLENALEACQRVPKGSRFITLNAQVRREVLFISMDNSYNGCVRSENGLFYSSKRAGFGQGLRSIQSLAEAHDGAASFSAMENAFRSEVYFRL